MYLSLECAVVTFGDKALCGSQAAFVCTDWPVNTIGKRREWEPVLVQQMEAETEERPRSPTWGNGWTQKATPALCKHQEK